MNKRKILGKIGAAELETAAFVADSFALPVFRSKQEKAVRQLYQQANDIKKQAGLPKKTYKRINSKGQKEEIR